MASFLVVDDDPSAVKGMTQLLAADGHAVAPVTAGAEAVEALTHEAFDVVVTDLEMPDVDGHAVVRITRGHQPEACVVVVTARAEDHGKALADAGACIVTNKPLDYEQFTKAITECQAHGGPGAHGGCHMRSTVHGPEIVKLRRR